MDIKIGIAYHKKAQLLNSPVYIPIHVGKALSNSCICNQGDDEGDNISKENIYYCELTALYWLWKNTTSDFKGLFHYRRILFPQTSLNSIFRSIIGRFRSRFYVPEVSLNQKDFVRIARDFSNKIENLCSRYDIITTKKIHANLSVQEHFSSIGMEYMNLLDEYFQESGKDYLKIYNDYRRGNTFYFANISIMKDELFNEYCSFLFSALEDVKQKLLNRGYIKDLYKEKIFSRKLGYLGEILTGVYITNAKKHNYRVKELSVARCI